MQETDLIIKGGKALLMDARNTLIENASIVVNNNDIVAIGDSKDIEKKYHAPKIIDAQNSLVMPGFVNCHTHAPMT